jgi:Tol biopolymer transport system component
MKNSVRATLYLKISFFLFFVIALIQAKTNELPLKPTKVIEFTTDEGTWVNLDVSSDGNFIVFELLGDLYLLDIGENKAKQITSGMAYDTQPRFSPDDKKIVFLSDRSGSEKGVRYLNRPQNSKWHVIK